VNKDICTLNVIAITVWGDESKLFSPIELFDFFSYYHNFGGESAPYE